MKKKRKKRKKNSLKKVRGKKCWKPGKKKAGKINPKKGRETRLRMCAPKGSTVPTFCTITKKKAR